jgi:aspartyl protease family protein
MDTGTLPTKPEFTMSVKHVILILIAASCVAFSGCRRQRLADSGSNFTSRSQDNGMHHGKQVIPMSTDKSGAYYVMAKINGVEMKFILDTGASVVSISIVEAEFLYKQGKLDQSDILGQGQLVDATGGISNNTIINLRNVTIGSTTIHNVQAAVSDNQEAPLLLGQTVLSRFGKMTVDYTNRQLIFE